MSRTVYLNGAWVSEEEARISIFDRAILFADAVYEVSCVIDGKLLDFSAHMKRLAHSLSLLKIGFAVDEKKLLALHHDILKRNKLREGLVYLQVSRGAADRSFYCDGSIKPNFFMFTQDNAIDRSNPPVKILKLLSVPEGRWANRHIKTIQLLYSSMTKTEARERGADDVVYVENGFITEASASNFHMVDRNGTVVTRPLDHSILPGITRARMIKVAAENGIRVEERPFSLDEAYAAQELFITSATNFVTPVVRLDDKIIADGKPGNRTIQLRSLYLEHVPRS